MMTPRQVAFWNQFLAARAITRGARSHSHLASARCSPDEICRTVSTVSKSQKPFKTAVSNHAWPVHLAEARCESEVITATESRFSYRQSNHLQAARSGCRKRH